MSITESNAADYSNIIDIAVIGGGPSGMAAAISAKKYLRTLHAENRQVVLFERNDRIGKKLLMTGNGRCNLTNLDTDRMHFHGSNAGFSEKILDQFPPTSIISFFEEIGVVCTEEDKKIFPLSLHAGSVLDSLRLALIDLEVQVRTGAKVSGISKDSEGYTLIFADGQKFFAKAVIVAAGGKSAPSTGSDGEGYELLRTFSHKLNQPLPSIVQLKTASEFCKPLSGNKLFGTATLVIDGVTIRKEEGDILFTDYGLSGPPILQLSGFVSRALYQKKDSTNPPDIYIHIDFLPMYSSDKVLSMLYERRAAFAGRRLEDFLTGLFHKRLSVGLLRQVTQKQLSAHVSSLSDRETDYLAQICKALPIHVNGTMPFANAQTTAGGIATDHFDACTLSSSFEKGLYACGEILDVDGDCGGFNLQWAWASGFAAGESAAKYVTQENNV